MSNLMFWLEGLTGGAASFIGALFGFVFGVLALTIGAFINFWLNRRRDDRLRHEEAKSVAAALYGEILLLREQVAYVGRVAASTFIEEGTSRRPTRRFDATFLEYNILKDPPLYAALASKLGLLSPPLVLSITRFHDNYESARTWLPRLVKNENRSFEYSVLHVLEPVWGAIFDVVPALREIERMLSIETPAPDPKTGEMGSVIDMEKEVFNTPSMQ